VELEDGALDLLADAAGPVVGHLHPLLPTVDLEDDLCGDAALLERQPREGLVADRLELVVPDRAADVLEQLPVGDDERQLAEAEPRLDGLLGGDDAAGPEDAVEHRLDDGVDGR